MIIPSQHKHSEIQHEFCLDLYALFREKLDKSYICGFILHHIMACLENKSEVFLLFSNNSENEPFLIVATNCVTSNWNSVQFLPFRARQVIRSTFPHCSRNNYLKCKLLQLSVDFS